MRVIDDPTLPSRRLTDGKSVGILEGLGDAFGDGMLTPAARLFGSDYLESGAAGGFGEAARQISETAKWKKYAFSVIFDPSKGPGAPDFSMHFMDPGSPPLTSAQQATLADRLNSRLDGRLVVTSKPNVTAAMPRGWKRGQPLSFRYNFEAIVRPDVRPEALVGDISGVVNNTMQSAIGYTFSSIAVSFKSLAGGLGGIVGSAFWGAVKPIALPAAIVAGLYLAWTIGVPLLAKKARRARSRR